jgi:hypothetical protein
MFKNMADLGRLTATTKKRGWNEKEKKKEKKRVAVKHS